MGVPIPPTDLILPRWFEQWSAKIVWAVACQNIVRFEALASNLKIARNILSDRLKKLVEDGILEKRKYSERPPRHEYLATSRGHDVMWLLSLHQGLDGRWNGGPRELDVTCGCTSPEPLCVTCVRPVSFSPLP